MNLSKAKQLLDALDIDPEQDIIHPENKAALASRTHKLGKHPAFPEQGNYEELIASDRYKKLVAKLEKYTGLKPTEQNLPALLGILQQAVPEIHKIERGNERRLEALAVDLVLELPEFKSLKEPYDSGEVLITPEITTNIDLEGVQFSTDKKEQEKEEIELTDLINDVDAETIKRHFINALIQGSSVSKNYAFELFSNELNQINPKLLNLYGALMALSDLGYWVMPSSAISAAKVGGEGVKAGSSRVKINDDGTPEVIAKGICFPVLIQELIKGLMELVSMHGLPGDKYARQRTLKKSDFIDYETWDMLLGPEIWDRLISSFGGGAQELTMHLYDKLISMDAQDFHATIKQLLSNDKKQVKKIVDKLISEIKADQENEGFETVD